MHRLGRGRLCDAEPAVKFAARGLAPGRGTGAVVAIAPLSFWGGYDPVSGLIIDRHHPACGRSLGGVVLVMPSGRGSSSSSTVLAEAIRLGTAPAAILLAEPDPILVVGAMVAESLYGRQCAIAVLLRAEYDRVAAAAAANVVVDAQGASVVIP
jgi:predicted aconitase with swiveling domain